MKTFTLVTFVVAALASTAIAAQPPTFTNDPDLSNKVYNALNAVADTGTVVPKDDAEIFDTGNPDVKPTPNRHEGEDIINRLLDASDKVKGMVDAAFDCNTPNCQTDAFNDYKNSVDVFLNNLFTDVYKHKGADNPNRQAGEDPIPPKDILKIKNFSEKGLLARFKQMIIEYIIQVDSLLPDRTPEPRETAWEKIRLAFAKKFSGDLKGKGVYDFSGTNLYVLHLKRAEFEKKFKTIFNWEFDQNKKHIKTGQSPTKEQAETLASFFIKYACFYKNRVIDAIKCKLNDDACLNEVKNKITDQLKNLDEEYTAANLDSVYAMDGVKNLIWDILDKYRLKCFQFHTFRKHLKKALDEKINLDGQSNPISGYTAPAANCPVAVDETGKWMAIVASVIIVISTIIGIILYNRKGSESK